MSVRKGLTINHLDLHAWFNTKLSLNGKSIQLCIILPYEQLSIRVSTFPCCIIHGIITHETWKILHDTEVKHIVLYFTNFGFGIIFSFLEAKLNILAKNYPVPAPNLQLFLTFTHGCSITLLHGQPTTFSDLL